MKNKMWLILSGLPFVAVAVSCAAESMESIKFEKVSAGILRAKQIADDKTVGTIQYALSGCTIDSLEVDSDLHRMGIGTHLFASAVNEMKSCERITWTATLRSIDFYFKQGAQISPHELVYGISGDNPVDQYGRLTAGEKSNHLQYLYKLKAEDPTAATPYVLMFLDNKRKQ